MQQMYDTFSFSGKAINCYGLKVVENTLARHGIGCQPFDLESKHRILVSLYWPEQIYPLIKWLYQEKMEDRAVLVGGNTATANPDILLAFVDRVYLGDGEEWDGSWEHRFIVEKENPLSKDIARTVNILPIAFEDVQMTRRAFCEIARGCRNRCLFCQYGWMKPYREADIADIRQIILRAKTKSIRAFSADRFQHSHYPQIRVLLEKKGAADTGSDVSLPWTLKHPEFLAYTKKVRTGIEGMSERLRFLVGKHYTDDDVIEFCVRVAEAGIKCLDWYMIYGLPTETAGDVEAFRKLLLRLDKVMPEGYTLAIHWNAFTPSAQTPFQWDESAYGYDTEPMQRLLFTRKDNQRITLMHKPKFTSDATLLKRMLAIRGFQENRDLIFTLAKHPRYFKTHRASILKEYTAQTGLDLIGKWPEDTVFPWDKWVNYPRDKMWKVRQGFMRQYQGT